MKKIFFLITITTVLISANNIHGKNPKSNSNNVPNSNNYSKFFEYEKNTQRKVDDTDTFIERVQIVNMSELIGKTFIFNNKAYIIPRKDILYIGKVNNNGTIDLEKEIKFKKLDDNCISIDRGETCFTIRSSTMLPEVIRVSDGKTLEIGHWKDPSFHKFLLKWKGK